MVIDKKYIYKDGKSFDADVYFNQHKYTIVVSYPAYQEKDSNKCAIRITPSNSRGGYFLLLHDDRDWSIEAHLEYVLKSSF